MVKKKEKKIDMAVFYFNYMQGKGSQSELWFVVIDITFYSRGCTIYKYIYIHTHTR